MIEEYMSFEDQVVTFMRDDNLKGKGGIVKVSRNGEVSFDYNTYEFIVYDETYAYEVGRTCYPLVAVAMMNTYCKHYLGKDDEEAL